MRVVILGLGLLSLGALGDSGDIDICKKFEIAAGQIMTARQVDASYSNLFDSFSAIEDKNTREVHLGLLDVAYTQYPSYKTDSNQQNAIDEFKNLAFIACVNNLESLND